MYFPGAAGVLHNTFLKEFIVYPFFAPCVSLPFLCTSPFPYPCVCLPPSLLYHDGGPSYVHHPSISLSQTQSPSSRLVLV